MSMDGFIGVVTIVLFVSLILMIGYKVGSDSGYKEGQIGALSGKSIDYHLVTNDNNSVTWELIDE